MILVARRFGFSMWLMIWEAASLPSWPAPMSGFQTDAFYRDGEDIVADQDCCRAVFLHKEPAYGFFVIL